VSGHDHRPLAGRAALVTGGSQGLGFGMAEALARAGGDVAILARRENRLREAAAELETHGVRVVPLAADLGDADRAMAAVDDAAEALGRLDVLVTAAAAQLRKPLLEVTPQDFDDLVAVNLRAVYFMGQRAARHMLARERVDGEVRGKLINVASLTAVGAWPDVSVYGMSKGGVVQLTKAMALELAPEGICANAIGPGTFRTELTEPIYSDPERAADICRRIPMGRPGLAHDLAGATVFLASDASDYVTGQVLWVDGGWLVS
jgi:NAD(P)-dependent dehydrogenase (short-subunit alcohol dehydrogenase family)